MIQFAKNVGQNITTLTSESHVNLDQLDTRVSNEQVKKKVKYYLGITKFDPLVKY